MKTTIKVEVTEEFIQRGKPCTAGDCPVALAIDSAMKDVLGYLACQVTSVIALYGDWGTQVIESPPEVCTFVARFDQAGRRLPRPADIKPFTFELDVPL